MNLDKKTEMTDVEHKLYMSYVAYRQAILAGDWELEEKIIAENTAYQAELKRQGKSTMR